MIKKVWQTIWAKRWQTVGQFAAAGLLGTASLFDLFQTKYQTETMQKGQFLMVTDFGIAGWFAGFFAALLAVALVRLIPSWVILATNTYNGMRSNYEKIKIVTAKHFAGSK